MTFSLLSTRPLTGSLSRRHRGRRTLATQRPWASPAFRTDSTGLASGALLRLHVHGMGGGASCESPDSGDQGRTCELVVLTSSQVKLMLQEPRREQRGVRLGETVQTRGVAILCGRGRLRWDPRGGGCGDRQAWKWGCRRSLSWHVCTCVYVSRAVFKASRLETRISRNRPPVTYHFSLLGPPPFSPGLRDQSFLLTT